MSWRQGGELVEGGEQEGEGGWGVEGQGGEGEGGLPALQLAALLP